MTKHAQAYYKLVFSCNRLLRELEELENEGKKWNRDLKSQILFSWAPKSL